MPHGSRAERVDQEWTDVGVGYVWTVDCDDPLFRWVAPSVDPGGQ